MSTIYCTFVSKKHRCPYWDVDLTITAKYCFFDEKNPFKAKYVSSTCPIIENIKLPQHKQDKSYKFHKSCGMQNECLHSVKFNHEIDVRKDGYSQ